MARDRRVLGLIAAQLLVLASAPADASPWYAPVRRLALTLGAAGDAARPYDLSLRPRMLVGELSIACERNEGRPCGDGLGAFLELDSEAGDGRWVTAGIRLRGVAGTEDYDDGLDVDRLYLRGTLGKLGITVGRDVLALGPVARTRLGWGDHAPPLDHVRVETLEPVELHPSVHVSALYAVGRLRAPQTFPGNLVSILRGRLDLGTNIELGATHLLQLGGEGALPIGFVDFLLEHVRRKDLSASETDSSNRRAGVDIAVRIPELRGLRLYYAAMFEDARVARFIDALRYDADHLVGAEVEGVTVEWHQTGVRSQEHTPRTTGFTNAGRVTGSPLGPDAWSLYAAARVGVRDATLEPWLEVARLASDTYHFIVDGPINRLTIGPTETRYRIGLRDRVPLRPAWAVEGSAWFEHVEDFAFENGTSRNNAGVTATLIWQPSGALGKLTFD